MKTLIKLLFILPAFAAPTSLIAQRGSYTINSKVGPVPETAKAYLTYGDAATGHLDSTNIVGGTFSFTGKLDFPQHAYVAVSRKGIGTHDPDLEYIPIYLEDGVISINSPDSLTHAVIAGGPVNADWNRLSAALADSKAKLQALVKEYISTPEPQKSAKIFTDMIVKKRDSLGLVQKDVYYSFIKDNPGSIVSLLTVKSCITTARDATDLEKIYNYLSPQMRATKPGAEIAESITKLKRIGLGVIAPDFTQPDTSGKSVSLHDFKGKYVLVDFWASWCGPCRAENPNVVKAYNEYQGKGFTVLGVSLDRVEDKDKWIKAVHDDHLPWTQVSDLSSWKNQAAQLYSINAIPMNFLIGPDGRIVASNLRGELLENKLKEIFGGK